MSGIFGLPGSTGSTRMDLSSLVGYYQSKNVQRTVTPQAPQRKETISDTVAPWSRNTKAVSDLSRVREALGAPSFINPNETDINRPGVTSEHRKLFAIYKGLSRLQALAERSAEGTITDAERKSLNTRFLEGIAEVKDYVTKTEFDKFHVQFGEKLARVESGLRKPRPPTLYETRTLVTGAASDAIPGLDGNARFSVEVNKNGAVTSVAMDLSEISGPVSLTGLVTYMNGKLEAAGVYTRMKVNTVAGAKTGDPGKHSLGVQTVPSERLSFAADVTSPAIYLGAVTGAGKDQTGQLQKLSDDGTGVSTVTTSKVTALAGISDIRATATDNAGNVYAVGTVTGDLGSGLVQGEQDVYLRKYDGAGKLVWSRLLGAAHSATGFAVAVDNSGNVAIAGKTSERLTSTSTGGGEDSFVTKFDSEGREVFTRQVAPTLDDQANALAFAADGSLFVAGQTKAAIASTVQQSGGYDAYLMKLTGTGAVDHVRQFGSTGDDRATSVAIDANGDVILGTVEGGEAKVRKLDPADGTASPVWEMTLGSLGEGSLNSLVTEGGNVYVAGSTTNADLSAGGQASIAAAHGGGSDAFVMKIADSGSSASAVFTAYSGKSGNESGAGVAVHNGAIYLAGSTSSSMNGGADPAVLSAFVRRLDDNGATVWTHQYDGAGSPVSARSIAVDGQGSSVLDQLGLPTGQLSFDETRTIVAGSSVRAGDHFFVTVNTSNRMKITVEAGDTMRSLAVKVNTALMQKGTAEISRTGGDGIRIKTKDANVIELLPGPDGFDALAGLGLEPMRLDASKKTAATGNRNFALGLKNDIAIDNKAASTAVGYQIGTAMEEIRGAYLAITRPPPVPGKKAPAVTPNPQATASYRTALMMLGG